MVSHALLWLCSFARSETKRLSHSTAQAINHPWLMVLPVQGNDGGGFPIETMSASEILTALNVKGFERPSESIDSSPVATTSKPLVAGLASAISLDQSPRPNGNSYDGEADGEGGDDSMVDSQAIGMFMSIPSVNLSHSLTRLRCEHRQTPTLSRLLPCTSRRLCRSNASSRFQIPYPTRPSHHDSTERTSCSHRTLFSTERSQEKGTRIRLFRFFSQRCHERQSIRISTAQGRGQ